MLFIRRFAPAALLLGALSFACSTERDRDAEPAYFDDHSKTGALSLMIVGDYFHNRFILELTEIAQALSPRARQIIICTERYRAALAPFLATNGVENVEYVTLDASSPVLTQWARDVAVAGKTGNTSSLVVSPFKHASSEQEAALMAGILQQMLPDRSVQLAPFVFESGNLAFVDADGRRVLIAGRKVLFDNEVYQAHPWAAGYDSPALVAAMAQTFDVDTVIVVGRATERPETRLYFEYHIDMGMAVLSENQAVVSQLTFPEEDEAALSRAIDNRHPLVIPFFAYEQEPKRLHGILSDRLRTVAAEYDDYARVVGALGVRVHRSAVGWQQVLGSMSWTNVLQTPGRIAMPLYPDSLHGRATSAAGAGGQLSISLDVAGLENERFVLSGRNAENYRLYTDLGYQVIAIPEYLHYMMGGIHCFVNILE
jgi:hypothetical protein